MRAFFPNYFLAATALCVPAFSAVADAEPEPQAATTDAEPAAAQGEYVVLVSEKTLKQKDWKKAAAKFAKHHRAKIIVWRGNDIAKAKNALKKAAPRYVAVIARPQEIDRVFVAKLHTLSREMNADIYGDFIWGIITGRDGKTAAELLAKDEPLILDRALGTTNFDRQRFKQSFFITDWGRREFVETENYVSKEKTNAKPDEEMVDIFAEQWEKIRPQFLMSASHATEFNLEMPFGEGLIASAGTDFYLVPKEKMPDFRRAMGNAGTSEKFFKTQKLKKLPRTQNEKVWIAAGNCLFGDCLRTPFSMAVTAISAANVKQLVGYTVPTWFGEGGWGTSGQFFGGHQATSVGQAWFFNNQILLKNLPAALTRYPVPLSAEGMEGIYVDGFASNLAQKGVRISRELIGRLHDRDTVAFYGDPLFRTRFNPDAPSTQPWDCRTRLNGSARLFTVKTTRGNAYKGDFCLWFPERIFADENFSALRIGEKETAVAPDILTENFVIFRNLELGEGEKLELVAHPKK